MLSTNNYSEQNHLLTELTPEEADEINGGDGTTLVACGSGAILGGLAAGPWGAAAGCFLGVLGAYWAHTF